jgi:hypothetical protein
MRYGLLLIAGLALAGCSGGNGGNEANAIIAEGEGSAKGPVQTNSLVGLYEGGSAQRRNQMCVVDRAGERRFGLVVWGENDHSCSGAGTATQQGSSLRLAMTGDEECAIEARIEGTRVTLPAELPQGCAYYCGARARMAGVQFDKTGGTEQDALKATDLVGEPLCAG